MNLIAHLEEFTLLEWILFSLLSNIALYLFSIGLYIVIDQTCAKQKIQDEAFPVTPSDVYLSLLTVVLNTVVMLIAVYCWKIGWLEYNESATLAVSIVEIIGIVLVMDFLMFVFHYLAHSPGLYPLLHYRHHEHSSTNYLSLFVLHPFETLGFGLMMITVFICYDFSITAIAAYVFINLVWGTIGHLNREFFPKWADRLYVGTTRFHNQHHIDERHNFGFYTSIWDRLFRTFKR
ncbi:sterol desaturase family protein [Sphingobacterium paludis]|uniref:Sterol desaturase/sphingolipid hydroxylase (Fatty acid hydroxylase superfamily) n=1 Tax=Sphingobacterium paludis TaxID=1476465 RepID=A0A4R7D1X4_9SPHI|nr:sterol desaturase family protein [Sphingobacterium paludis]TDS14979.1 sterol desaturase/sphingolipid hydroxylase (fatty acid hydroxylase superfamily) [Sphingobacterium paludis]